MSKSDDEEMQDNHSEDDSDKDSDSYDSSSDEEQQTTIVDDGAIDRLEVKLMSEPYNYENHVAYINALRQAGKHEKLREARENLNKLFPLLEEQWLEWLEDDQRFATSDEEKAQLVSLYQRALKEYQSANIWLSYCTYIRDTYAPSYMLTSLDPTNLKKVRGIYEEALTSVGIHVQEGAKLWNSFREFEQSVLEALQESKADAASINKQTDVVRSTFKRQLSVPLMGMQDTWNTYTAWEKGNNPKEFEPAYQRALEMLNERLPFEQKILTIRNTPLNPDYSKFDRWRSYLDFEEEKGDPSRIMNLYERAIKVYFLMLDLWQKYIQYLEKGFKGSSSMIISLHERAVRNVPYSGQLWISFMRALERSQKSKEEVDGIFEQALVSGLQTPEDYGTVFQGYINYVRRQAKMTKEGRLSEEEGQNLRGVLNRAHEYISQYFPESAAYQAIQHYWGGIEARLFHNIENSRKVLSELVKHSHSYDHWIQYINIERYMGDSQNARNLFKKAYLTVHDYPEKMWDEWLLFEEEVGTFEQYDFALEKINTKRRELESHRLKEAEKAAKELAAQTKKSERRDKKMTKRKIGEERSYEPKRQKVHDQETTETKDETMGEATSEPRTAFVVNLDYNMKEPELQEIFSKFGAVKDVRLIKDKKGTSKGFAYIEFDSEEAAQASLALHGTQLKGRTLKVTISTPPDKNKVRKPTESGTGGGGEVNPLAVFISGIPVGVNEDKLKELFAQCGTIKEVRLVKDKITGQLKGFAFIDFETAEAAEAALKMDQTQMYGKPIRVHKSVSSLKNKTEESAATEPVKEEKETEFKMPKLVPRAMRVQTNKPGSGSGGPPKSNAEFRKLLNR